MHQDVETRLSRICRSCGRIPVVCIGAALFVVGAETSARIMVAYKDQIKSQLPIPLGMLHEYQQRDPANSSNWILRPGFVETFAEVKAKTRTGQARDDVAPPAGAVGVVGAEAEPTDPFIRINKDGFRGPEIDRAHSRLRILTIGDSVTFGTIESHGYPRLLEDELRNRGLDAEVINAGVEG